MVNAVPTGKLSVPSWSLQSNKSLRSICVLLPYKQDKVNALRELQVKISSAPMWQNCGKEKYLHLHCCTSMGRGKYSIRMPST